MSRLDELDGLSYGLYIRRLCLVHQDTREKERFVFMIGTNNQNIMYFYEIVEAKVNAI